MSEKFIKPDEFITVAVFSYNASQTILECLEGIFRQTYKNLDIIFNDDASVDDSVNIAREWLKNKKDRFRNIQIISNKENNGINWCFNNVLKHCNTTWIKAIAADDIVLPNCVIDNWKFVYENSIATVVYSKYVPFCDKQGRVLLNVNPYDIFYAKKVCSLAPQKQYDAIIRRDMVFSSTIFLNSKVYHKMGGIPLDIKNLEDWPMRILLTLKGYRLFFMEKDTVLYRVGNSVSHSQKYVYNIDHLKQKRLVKKKLIYPNISKYNVVYYWDELMELFREIIIIILFCNKKNKVVIVLNKLLMMLEFRNWKEAIFRSWLFLKRGG